MCRGARGTGARRGKGQQHRVSLSMRAPGALAETAEQVAGGADDDDDEEAEILIEMKNVKKSFGKKVGTQKSFFLLNF